jgi:N-acetylneuraminic acid mutarotase
VLTAFTPALNGCVRVAVLYTASMLLTACGEEGRGSGGSSLLCTPDDYAVGGSVSGLLSGRSMVLQNNGSSTKTISTNGSFSFAAPIASGSSYTVTILTQPAGETCAVTNAGGTVVSTNVSNVTVTCTPVLYRVSGVANGLLSGRKVVVQDNGADELSISTDGSFRFNTPIAAGAAYSVTVRTQPAEQTCSVANGTGNVGVTDVTDIIVTCASEWTWIAGLNTGNASGVYGTQGIPNSGFVAGARSGAKSWCDASGHVWLFGGNGMDSVGNSGYLNDLWKYNPGDNTGTWVSGSNTTDAGGVYGTQGAASLGNVPGARENASSWSDPSGSLWLFGGFGNDSARNSAYLNDLWKFDPNTGWWTWIGGLNGINVSGTYGTRGVASASNVPGSRSGAISWTDSSGNLWLFGGYRYDSGGIDDHLNDLWKFSPIAGAWTWVAGSNTANAGGVYGIQGTAAAGNVPGGREFAVSWADGSGNLWLFGGNGYDSNQSVGRLNDLWKFNPIAGTWTWMGGSRTADSRAAYGTQGIPAPENLPGARGYATSWTDSSGSLWLFGGDGLDSSDQSGYLNDLWKFDPGAGTWTWVGGLNTGGASGVYGAEGIAASTDMPGSRKWANGCADSFGNFWLFGGEGTDSAGNAGFLNDLWKYVR